MTLNDPKRKIEGLWIILAILGCDTSLYHLQGGATLLSFVIQIENLVFLYDLRVNIPIFS